MNGFKLVMITLNGEEATVLDNFINKLTYEMIVDVCNSVVEGDKTFKLLDDIKRKL